jgi:hypothetical protein
MAFDQVAFGVSFTLNRWYHVVLTCDGTDMRINVDGDARAYFYNTTNPFASSKLTLGNFTDGTEPIGGHIGHIDDFRLTKDVKYLYILLQSLMLRYLQCEHSQDHLTVDKIVLLLFADLILQATGLLLIFTII